MKIAVLGAAGKTGVQLVEQALAAGHEVNALVRNGHRISEQPNLRVLVGDATDPGDVTKASNGADVIISTLGPGSDKSHLMSKAVVAVIEGSKRTDVKRLILLSASATQTDHLSTGAKVMAKMMKGVVSDKVASENLLRSSSLDWTIVYATLLTDDPKGSGVRIVSTTEKIRIKHKIGRADVAAWMLEEAEQDAYVKNSVIISK